MGSYLVELLIEDSAIVTVADNLSRGRIENLSGVMDKISFNNIDLRYLSRCEQICRGQDTVLNLAAPAFGVEYSMTHHGEMLTDVTTIGFNLLALSPRQQLLCISRRCRRSYKRKRGQQRRTGDG
jgi:nucleoside-diphosphate-sugar epimerase